MQLDSATGEYGDAGDQTNGFKGATLNYRKIQGLEFDPVYLQYVQRPVFRDICARLLGPQTDVSVFRAMFMNKPANRGTWLPWHQDGWNFLDRDPLITVWTALDPATVQNGCVQIVPGSHRAGVINPSHDSGFLTPEQTAEHVPPQQVVSLELEAGEVVLLHNWLLHASDVNRSTGSRRAFSVCYIDAATRAEVGMTFPVVFGARALQPDELTTERAQTPSCQASATA
jgi:ectoine hydroxylase-related dioxygenase (phytanoyl-CoA dioxygenase family)